MTDLIQPTVLVVENDEDILHLVTLLLTRAGFRCVTAVSGAQGIGCFLHEHPQLVITDLNMPGGDGVTLIDAIRRVKEVPVIVMTAFAVDYQRRAQMRSDVVILPKPFDSKKLLRQVRGLCRKSVQQYVPYELLQDSAPHNPISHTA